MGSFNLPTMTLINKYDFSYGDADGEEELDEAAIRFDLKFVPILGFLSKFNTCFLTST